MKTNLLTKLTICSFAILLTANTSSAAAIPISRDSRVSGGGIGIASNSASTVQLFADFNETVAASSNDGNYISEYSVSHHSTVSSTGFSFSNEGFGSVTAGPYASVDTGAFFDMVLYVDVPSVITFSVDYPHPLGDGSVGVGFYFRPVTRDGNTVGYPNSPFFGYSGGQVPGTFTASYDLSADSTVGYQIHIEDGSGIGSFSPKPASYSYRGAFQAAITPVPEPNVAALSLCGAFGALLRRRRGVKQQSRNA